MITDPRVENYIYAMLPERGTTLQEIERQAKERDIPIVGPAVGRLFYQYARLIGAKTVFEMGSAVGYSTIWWAMAVAEGGKVHYTDGSRKNADEAHRYFAQAGVADRIEVHVGDAIEILSERKVSRHRQARLSAGRSHGSGAGAAWGLVHHGQYVMEWQCGLRRGEF
jgi:predicted O-methyltransferase YrrM